MKIYTRTGDRGTTSLVSGQRISKSSLRLEAYGTVDELSSHLGLLAAILGEVDDHQQIQRIQNNLFNVGAHLATPSDASQPPLTIPDGEVAHLEQMIDAIVATLPETRGFILPGGCVAAAQCHVCRTVCRRAERCIVALAATEPVGDEIQQYVNRLSDYLFVLAKKINFNKGIQEIIWQNACE